MGAAGGRAWVWVAWLGLSAPLRSCTCWWRAGPVHNSLSPMPPPFSPEAINGSDKHIEKVRPETGGPREGGWMGAGGPEAQAGEAQPGREHGRSSCVSAPRGPGCSRPRPACAREAAEHVALLPRGASSRPVPAWATRSPDTWLSGAVTSGPALCGHSPVTEQPAGPQGGLAGKRCPSSRKDAERARGLLGGFPSPTPIPARQLSPLLPSRSRGAGHPFQARDTPPCRSLSGAPPRWSGLEPRGPGLRRGRERGAASASPACLPSCSTTMASMGTTEASSRMRAPSNTAWRPSPSPPQSSCRDARYPRPPPAANAGPGADLLRGSWKGRRVRARAGREPPGPGKEAANCGTRCRRQGACLQAWGTEGPTRETPTQEGGGRVGEGLGKGSLTGGTQGRGWPGAAGAGTSSAPGQRGAPGSNAELPAREGLAPGPAPSAL